MGDAVLAVFGIPQAHEDDPERAVWPPSLSATTSRASPRGSHTGTTPTCSLRISINTGDVVSSREAAARGELTVSGDMGPSHPSASAGRRARRGSRRRPHPACGRSPQATRLEAGSLRRGSGAPCTPGSRARSPRLPRGAESKGADGADYTAGTKSWPCLPLLATRAVRERVPQLVTLFGAAGVGKSRLLRRGAPGCPRRGCSRDITSRTATG